MIFSWIILIIEGIVCFTFKDLIPENNDIICTLVIVINIIAVIYEIGKLYKSKNLSIIIWCGFFIRLLFLFWDLNFREVFVLPNSGQDTESYALWAKSGYLTGDYMRGGMYAKFIALIYCLFGIQRPIAQYVNILLFVTTVYFLKKIMNYLQINNLIQKKIFFLLSFLPNFAITNSILLRETLIVCLLTISIFYFVKWLNNNNVITFIKSVLFVCFASTIHSGTIAVLLGEVIVYVLYDRRTKSIKFNQKSILSIILVIIGFFILYSQFGNILFGKFQGVESAGDIINTANKYNTGGSAYDAGFAINNSMVSLIVNTPIRMFYFVASPLPWSWRSLNDIIAFCFSSTLFIYTYYRAWKVYKGSQSQDRTMVIIFLILALCSALVFAWGVSNAGTALRHREKFITVYLLLLALCESFKYNKKLNKRLL